MLEIHSNLGEFLREEIVHIPPHFWAKSILKTEVSQQAFKFKTAFVN